MRFLEVTSYPKPKPYVDGNYGRISARLGSEKVYIAASSAHECRQHKAALIKLSRTHGIPMLKINNLLYGLALSHLDTAPVDLEAEQFEFWALPDGLHDVPDPEDNVDAIKAGVAYQRDTELSERILGQGTASVAELLLISNNQRAWCRYFSVRHPDPLVRARLVRVLVEHDALRAECAEKAQRQLDRKRANGKQTN